jgi:periplasmic protein TonB
MADSVQMAQAIVLEIPVTIQGAKPVDGTDQRELFTESTKTTIVFQNGAVLKLDAKVLPGQCLFLRNDQSKREILCKVVESRQSSQAGYTHLEFTSHNPEFWGALPEQPPSAGQKPATQKEIPAAENPVAPPTLESCAPITGQTPAAPPETAIMAPSDPAPEPPKPLPEPDWDEAKDAELAAALIAMEAGAKAHRQSATEVPKKILKEAAPQVAQEQSPTNPATTSPATVVSIPPPWIRRMRELTAGKNPVALGIAATVLLAAVLGVTWRAKSWSSTHGSNRAFAASAPPPPHALPAAAPSSPTPASVAAASVNKSGAAHGAAVANIPAAAKSDVASVPRNKAIEDSGASTALKAGATIGLTSPDRAVLGQPTHQKPNGRNTGETIPAKIVWQSPPSIPPWAKDLDLDRVVQLDALIDEKGNVAATKPLSGPRLLQPAAERAVALWVFEPALTNGKPTATHMVLTVQFQK